MQGGNPTAVGITIIGSLMADGSIHDNQPDTTEETQPRLQATADRAGYP
jgi:hypothetical protein